MSGHQKQYYLGSLSPSRSQLLTLTIGFRAHTLASRDEKSPRPNVPQHVTPFCDYSEVPADAAMFFPSQRKLSSVHEKRAVLSCSVSCAGCEVAKVWRAHTYGHTSQTPTRGYPWDDLAVGSAQVPVLSVRVSEKAKRGELDPVCCVS